MSDFKRRYTPELEKLAQDAPTRRKPKVAPAPAATPAQAPAPAKPSAAPTRGQHKAVPTAPTGGGTHGFPASNEVRHMQEALLNLANTASSTDVTSMEGNKEGVMEGKQTRQIPAVDALPNKFGPDGQLARPDGQMGDKQQHELSQQTKDDKNYLGGSDPFGKFLVQNYIGKDSFIGKQYLNVDVAGQSKREHASMNPTNLRGIIDTIKRIGSPNAKGERVVDGVWQTRTNNALHVVADLVEAVMGLSTDMGVKLAAYNPGYLAKFKQLVPDSWNMMKSQEEVNKRAEVITQHLNAMTKMFQQFNNDILNNKAVRQFIDQKEAFVNFPKDVQIPPELRASGIPGVQFNWVQNSAQNWISLNELSSLDNFKSFLRRVRISDQDPESIKKTLDLVTQAINSKTTADPGY
jgi:hypothetical protein